MIDIIVSMNGVDFGVFLGPEDNTYETLKTRAVLGDDWEREARLFMGEVAPEFG